MTNTAHPTITVIEPTWNHVTHLPANLGLLRVIHEAYPLAQLHFVGAAEQIFLMKQMAPPEIGQGIIFHSWQTGADKDTLPLDVFKTLRKIRALPSEITTGATRIVLSSCTPTVLASFNFLGLSKKSCAVLHGNANDLTGWRSRNPLRKAFDLHASMKRFCTHGGIAIVFEEIIRRELGNELPWIAPHLTWIPHPLTPEEASVILDKTEAIPPIKIAFAGNASIAKGFPEFIKLSQELTIARPGGYEFHAFGYLPNESHQIDQSTLITKASSRTLPRDEYITRLRNTDFIFAWHNNNYYSRAASGILYDAVNLTTPLIARRQGQIEEWESRSLPIGVSFSDINEAIDHLKSIDSKKLSTQRSEFVGNLALIRESFSIENIAKIFRKSFPIQ